MCVTHRKMGTTHRRVCIALTGMAVDELQCGNLSHQSQQFKPVLWRELLSGRCQLSNVLFPVWLCAGQTLAPSRTDAGSVQDRLWLRTGQTLAPSSVLPGKDSMISPSSCLSE